MKKSQNIILSAVLLAAIASCRSNNNEWSDGKDQHGHSRDTSIYRNGGYHYYRYYGGGWYPLSTNNRINTSQYAPASTTEISSPSFSPRSASGSIKSGGFGSSGHSSSGE